MAERQMVMDIIQIVKVHQDQNSSTYPPAVVAMLVAAILQMLWAVWYLARGGRGVIFKASNVAAATVFFLLFHIGKSLRSEQRILDGVASFLESFRLTSRCDRCGHRPAIPQPILPVHREQRWRLQGCLPGEHRPSSHPR
jgi:hypothetical protein